MSALVAHPAWQGAPAAAPVRRTPRRTSPAARGTLQLVGPGFVPQAAAPSVEPPARAAVRLTRRGRVVVAVVAVVTATALAVTLGVLAGRAVAPAASPAATVTVTVTAGETLWSVAEGAAAPGQDVRDVVADISRLNEIGPDGLRAGQLLVVPAG